MSRRIACFIDGFNLYHSLAATQERHPSLALKWLDLRSLCRSFAPIVAADGTLVSVDYFTAIPYHLAPHEPARVHRHLIYLRALTAQRQPTIHIHEGKISRQTLVITCDGHTKPWETWREKGTDVALAATVLEYAFHDTYDDAVIVSGDTDYAPLVSTFSRLYPNKTLRFALPFLRESRELRTVAPFSFVLSIQSYLSNQLSAAVRLPSGKQVHCPREWLSKPNLG